MRARSSLLLVFHLSFFPLPPLASPRVTAVVNAAAVRDSPAIISTSGILQQPHRGRRRRRHRIAVAEVAINNTATTVTRRKPSTTAIDRQERWPHHHQQQQRHLRRRPPQSSWAMTPSTSCRSQRNYSDDYSSATAAVYSDCFARRKMFPMIALTMERDPHACLRTCFAQYEFGCVVRVNADLLGESADEAAAAIFASHDDRAIYITFQGTTSLHQLCQEFGSLYLMVTFPGGGRVALYYWTAFERLMRAGLRDAYAALRERYPDYAVWFTGHSMGGSLASLASAYFSQHGLAEPHEIRLYAFAPVRTGDVEWALRVSRLVPHSFRIIHNWDYVPHVPENLREYSHHGVEVWYENFMLAGDPYKVCLGAGESPYCSSAVPSALWNWIDHFFYFGVFYQDACRICSTPSPFSKATTSGGYC